MGTFSLIPLLLLFSNKVNGLTNTFINEIDSFDVSEKWPQCKDVFEKIQTQGNCSSSWAISVASSIQDRRCIQFGVKDLISAYDLISCCSDCQLDRENGCNGGDPDLAFQYFINQGIVTEGCKPYTISPDPKSDAPKNTECVKSCESSYKKKYENDKIRGEDLLKFSHNNQAVMEEIMTNGSVIAELKLFDDFLSYKSGIYQHKSGKLRGYYYAKILGWGKTDNNVEYWRAAASFGSDWGKNGTFLILRGSDECGFESNIVAGMAENTSDVKSTTTKVSTPANLNCNKITAYFDDTFKDPNNHFLSFDAQMTITADINIKDKRIYFKFNKWNKTLSNGYYFGIWNNIDKIECNTDEKETCSLPFDSLNVFDTRFWSYNYSGYDSWLMYIYPLINQQFTLLNAMGNCATSLKNNGPLFLNPGLYNSCFCCGDEYNPHPLLKCPVSPWS